jgi:hypothetical protein
MRKILHLILASFIIGLFAKCKDKTDTAHEKYDIRTDTIFKFDTTGKSQTDRLKRLMAVSVLKKFDEARTQFIESDINNIYKVSELTRKGNTYHYQVTSDSIEIAIKYLCTPYQGEYQMVAIGEKKIIKLYYDQLRTTIKWDECHKTNENESCTTTKKIEIYDVNTYFKIDLIKLNEKQSEFNYFRKNIIIYK